MFIVLSWERIKKNFPTKKFGQVEVKMDFFDCFPEENKYGKNRLMQLNGWQIQLPHSCDEWVIGGVEDAEEMIKDLKEAIEFIKNNPINYTI